jgi:hypothetical protein
MVPKQLLPFVGVGIVVVGILVAALFWVQRGAHLELEGSIQKVRTLAVEEAASIAVLDFRFVNSADYPFVVRDVTVSLEDWQGQILEGAVVSEVDARRLFQYYPRLGQKFNDTLVARTRIAPHQTMDRMIAARFEIPEKRLPERRRLRIRVEDVDGPVSEIVENGR